MNEAFWLEKWEAQEIGFHQSEINDDLRNFWQALDPNPGETVFVPLCGKTRDMLWLRDRGHNVVGIELSRLAVSSFFSENGIEPTWSREGNFEVAAGNGIRVMCGDFFALSENDLAGVTAVYDRAALVALPRDMRERYAAHLLSILEPGARILLVTLVYPEKEMEGPPFSVPAAEVERLFSACTDLRLLSRRDILPDEPHFARRGITALESCVFRITLSANG